jgi:hypothetical protein
MGWTGHVASIGEKTGAHGVLMENSEGTRIGRPTCKWEDNIQMDLRKTIQTNGRLL